MKLENIDVSKLFPVFMRGDKDSLAMADVISETLQPLASEISKLSTWGQLEKLNAEELNALSDELNIVWYDKGLTDDQKRVLIANSDKVYMRLGTKAAVQEVVNDVFINASVEEWFDYGGRPHFFRINVTSSTKMMHENERKLRRVIEFVKRKSQWLEAIQNKILTSFNLNFGMTVAVQTEINLSIPNNK